MYAKNKQTVFSLSETLLGKGWYNLTRVAPNLYFPVDYESTTNVFTLLKQKIQALSADQRSTATVHIHLCLQAIVYENMDIPMSDSSVEAYSDMEATLRRVYIDHIKEIIALVPRPPIVMINHDKRFFACVRGTLRRREGAAVVHGSSFWCKLVSSLHGAEYGTHVISTETVSISDPHHHHL